MRVLHVIVVLEIEKYYDSFIFLLIKIFIGNASKWHIKLKET